MRVGLAAALLLVVAPAAANACTSNVLRVTSTAPASLEMTVSASKFCYIHYGSNGGVVRTVIASKPLKGRAKVGELGRVIYQAPARYTGRDSFVYALHALDKRNVVRVVRINVAVNVTPEAKTDNRR